MFNREQQLLLCILMGLLKMSWHKGSHQLISLLQEKIDILLKWSDRSSPKQVQDILLGNLAYYSVFKYLPRDDHDFYEINYLSIWDRDTGGLIGLFRPHQWDTERTAILVKGPAGGDNSSLFVAEEAYYAAHEGESFNSSEYVVPLKEDRGVTVYWSLGKHSSYSSYPPLFMALVDQIKQPEARVEPPDYVLKNAGTISNPTDLAPWLNYKDNWGPDKVSSVLFEAEGGFLEPQTWIFWVVSGQALEQ